MAAERFFFEVQLTGKNEELSFRYVVISRPKSEPRQVFGLCNPSSSRDLFTFYIPNKSLNLGLVLGLGCIIPCDKLDMKGSWEISPPNFPGNH